MAGQQDQVLGAVVPAATPRQLSRLQYTAETALERLSRRRDFLTPAELGERELLVLRNDVRGTAASHLRQRSSEDTNCTEQEALVNSVVDEVVQRWCGKENHLFRFTVWPHICQNHAGFRQHPPDDRALLNKRAKTEARRVLCYVRDPDVVYDGEETRRAASARTDRHVKDWVGRSLDRSSTRGWEGTRGWPFDH